MIIVIWMLLRLPNSDKTETMRSFVNLIPLIVVIFFVGCAEKVVEKKTITVTNPLDSERSFETVEIDLTPFLKDRKNGVPLNSYGIVDAESRQEIVSQTVDSDGDGAIDLLLFQPEIEAMAKRSFQIVETQGKSEADSIPACYSRFVPERTDDYAWENNRVAFRTYGPTAQKMVEEGVKGGTLSSGIDAWLKRVDYPIIDKWYIKELETDGSYHEDNGEGLDNFHVGVSRGVGGTAVKVDTAYHTSKNFSSWKQLYNGPIRTAFVLNYSDWDASGKKIAEEKHISLDFGSNLSRFEIRLKGTDTISAGLTLHEKKGVVKVSEEQGWASYWEPHVDSELGMGIVVPGGKMIGYEEYVTDTKDLSNLFVQLNLNSESEAVYYAGFGWKKSGQFTKRAEWEDYLDQFAEKINNPIKVDIR